MSLPASPLRFSRRLFMAAPALLLLPRAALAASLPAVTAWRDPGCGCCEKWVAHMQASGFSITMRDDSDRAARRLAARVPEAMASCHTALVGGYAIEGHVPAEAVKRLLAEKPAVAGLAVPGMPVGSPGMEYGDEVEPYAVFAFTAEGTTTAFAAYG